MDTFNETTGPFAPEYDTVRAEAQTDGESRETWFETDHATRGVSEWGQETFDENTYPEEEWEGDLEVNAPFASEDRSTELADARESAGPRPTLKRGSRGAEIQRAQTLLNDFLRRIASNPRECVDRSAARMAQMRDLLFSLRRNNQLPLVADGIFGPNTESATKLFQSCLGLVRDGIIGNVTWRYLEQSRSPRRSRRNPPPDNPGCALPEGPSGEFEAERDFELEMLGQTGRTVIPAVRPALSLYVNVPRERAGVHFFNVADYIARGLKAYANPRAGRCTPLRVGPTAFDTGADTIAAISAASACLKRPLAALHMVGHSTPDGIGGATWGEGIFSEVDSAHRARGARAIADIPVNALANNVVVVLHGCNLGAGADSFAELLYRHLAATLTSPVVFAHPTSGCAGRDRSWRRFDSRSPDGRAVRSTRPHYSEKKGLCEKPPLKREAEEETAWSTESEIVPSSHWGNEDTALESQWESSPEREPVWEETGLEAARRPCGCGQ